MATQNTTVKGQIVRSGLFFAMIFTWILFLAGQATCFASSVTLQWDPNTESDIAGYKVYYQADSSTSPLIGTGAAQGAAPLDVLKQTSATVSGLDPNHAYYFAVTAYNTSGVESSYSNIVAVPELAPPTTSLSYPANNATVSGTISVTANATDNVGVTKVEFYRDGTLQATDTSTPYVYSLNTTSLAAGPHTLMTKAYDAAGNVGQSSNVAVTVVNDSTSPTVSVTSPANNATVSGTVAITASASDNVAVSRVEFFENGVLLSASNVAPYSYSWNTTTVADGSHILTTKAYDAAGNVGQSSNVTVTVNAPGAPASPTALNASAPAANRVVLTWTDNANNELGVQVQRATNAAFTNGLVAVWASGINRTTYTDNTVAAGNTYYYRVRTGNYYAWSTSFSNTATVTTTVPVLAITTPSLANGAVNAAYNQTVAAIAGTTSYTWSATGLPTGLTINPGTGVISGTPANVVPSNAAFATFPVTITVQDSASTPATATTTLNLRINQTASAAPSGLVATAPAANRVVLTWTDNANNEVGVQVQRATNAAFTTGLVSVWVPGINRTTYTDNSVATGNTYYYRVRSGNYVAWSTTFSNTATVTTP